MARHDAAIGAWITLALTIIALVMMALHIQGCGKIPDAPEVLNNALTVDNLTGVWTNDYETLALNGDLTFRRVTPMETWAGTWDIVDADLGGVRLRIYSYESDTGIYTPYTVDEFFVLMALSPAGDRLTVEGVRYWRQ